MTYEKFVKATKADLVNKANECFATAAAAGTLNKPAALLEAQFYVGEIDRRDQNRISRRDFWLEIIVISLIGLEIVFGYFQGRVLDRLEQSASATAKTLTSLAAVTEEMQKTEQRLLALNYEVSVTTGFGFDGLSRVVTLHNAGKTNVTLWGYKLWNDRPFFQKIPGVMSPGVSYSIPGNAIYERMFKSVPHDNKADIPFETYLRNEKGEEYIVKNVFSAEWRNDALVITNSRTLLTRPERWSDYKN